MWLTRNTGCFGPVSFVPRSSGQIRMPVLWLFSVPIFVAGVTEVTEAEHFSGLLECGKD